MLELMVNKGAGWCQRRFWSLGGFTEAVIPKVRQEDFEQKTIKELLLHDIVNLISKFFDPELKNQ